MSGRLERAADVVEDQLEKVKEAVEDRLEEVKVRIKAARDRAEQGQDYPIESLEDVVVTVERGLSQFAKEFPEAIGRLFHFDFGPFTGYTVERSYEGTFADDVSEAGAAVSTRNGSVTWETWDGPGYKVIVTSKVRAEDGDAAEERAAEATLWEQTDRGFRLTAGTAAASAPASASWPPGTCGCAWKRKLATGPLRARELMMTSAQFNTANGSVRLEDVDAEELQVGTANGSVRISARWRFCGARRPRAPSMPA